MSGSDGSDLRIGKIGMTNMKTIYKLFQKIQLQSEDTGNNVTVVGGGQVGMTAVFAILIQGVSNNMTLVDERVNEKKLKGEMMDLQHGCQFMSNSKIQSSTDYAITAVSKVCLVAAGVRQREGESRLALVQRYNEVLKAIMAQLVKYCPDAILIIASNTVDILTIYFGASVACPRTANRHGAGPGEMERGARGGRFSAYEIIELKGYTSLAIGLSVSQQLCSVHPESTCIKSEHGTNKDLSLSLPCVLDHGSIADVVRQPLTASERSQLQKSVQLMG